MNLKKYLIKLTRLMLIIALLLSGIKIINDSTLNVSAESNDFAGGDGSEDDPYQISTAEQLDKVREHLSSGIYFKLVNNIDLSDYINQNDNTNGWKPIGTDGNLFYGHFDGAKHTIKGLWINRDSESYVGLFGYTGVGSSISNLGVEINDNGINGYSSVGGLVGHNNGNIENSYTTGNVNGSGSVGGLVGYINSGTITNCYTTGSISGVVTIGGLVGYNSIGTISYSYATGKVIGNGSVGGLVGTNYSVITDSYATGVVEGSTGTGGLVGTNYSDIINSHATGSVSGTYSIGGLVGDNLGNIENNYATGSVEGYGSIGGLVGNNVSNIENSYSLGSANGVGYVGGLVGGNSGGSIKNSYTTGSVTGENTIGGFVGGNSGNLENSYAAGSVAGDIYVGGFIGDNYTDGIIRNNYFDKDSTGQVNGVGNDNAIVNDITGLTTAQMTTSNTLQVNMIGLDSNTWKKRDKTDNYCYYPELASFYDKGELNTQSEKDSEQSVRVDRIELSNESITKEVLYGTSLGNIKTEYTHILDQLEIKGSIIWEYEDTTILNVSDSGSSYTGTFVPDDDLYKTVKNISITIEVAPKELIVTTDSKERIYGEDNPTFNVYITGFIQGENETNLTTVPTTSTTATITTEVGEYPITISGGEAENYYFTYKDGLLTIKSKEETTTPITKTGDEHNIVFLLSLLSISLFSMLLIKNKKVKEQSKEKVK